MWVTGYEKKTKVKTSRAQCLQMCDTVSQWVSELAAIIKWYENIRAPGFRDITLAHICHTSMVIWRVNHRSRMNVIQPLDQKMSTLDNWNKAVARAGKSFSMCKIFFVSNNRFSIFQQANCLQSISEVFGRGKSLMQHLIKLWFFPFTFQLTEKYLFPVAVSVVWTKLGFETKNSSND